MNNLMLLAAVFIEGVVIGVIMTSVLSHFRAADKRRTEFIHARGRILTGIKEKHEQEILREIFQATDALNGELHKSLQLLRASTEKSLDGFRVR